MTSLKNISSSYLLSYSQFKVDEIKKIPHRLLSFKSAFPIPSTCALCRSRTTQARPSDTALTRRIAVERVFWCLPARTRGSHLASHYHNNHYNYHHHVPTWLPIIIISYNYHYQVPTRLPPRARGASQHPTPRSPIPPSPRPPTPAGQRQGASSLPRYDRPKAALYAGDSSN